MVAIIACILEPEEQEIPVGALDERCLKIYKSQYVHESGMEQI